MSVMVWSSGFLVYLTQDNKASLPTTQALGSQYTVSSYLVIHSIPSWLVLTEFECMVQVTLPTSLAIQKIGTKVGLL